MVQWYYRLIVAFCFSFQNKTKSKRVMLLANYQQSSNFFLNFKSNRSFRRCCCLDRHCLRCRRLRCRKCDSRFDWTRAQVSMAFNFKSDNSEFSIIYLSHLYRWKLFQISTNGGTSWRVLGSTASLIEYDTRDIAGLCWWSCCQIVSLLCNRIF